MSSTSESFTVSGIAQRTGLDRRSVQRALLDVEPVSASSNGGRASPRYDRDEAVKALVDAGLPRESVFRLAPFGGSVSRLVAWNVLMRFVPLLQRVIAGERTGWCKKFSITQEQADHIGAVTALYTSHAADYLLADFASQCPGTAEIDDPLAGISLPTRNAKKGQFLDTLVIDDPLVHEMFEASVAAKKAQPAVGLNFRK